MAPKVSITHLFFVDDILSFGVIKREQWETLLHIFQRMGFASDLFINGPKSCIYFSCGNESDIRYMAEQFGVNMTPL